MSSESNFTICHVRTVSSADEPYIKSEPQFDQRICELCFQIFPDSEQFDDHMSKFHTYQEPPTPSLLIPLAATRLKFVCTECGTAFATKAYLEQHIRLSHQAIWSIMCQFCFKKYDIPPDVQGVTCPYCNQVNLFENNPSDADRPRKRGRIPKIYFASTTDSDEPPQPPRKRGRRAKTINTAVPDVLAGHSTCPRCHQQFENRILLRDHQIAEHPEHYSAYLCRHRNCNQKFSKYDEYTRHLEFTHQLKHVCSYCYKSFSAQQTLQQHLRMHTGERPFECDHCGKTFAVRDYLVKHIRTHTGEKPYECELCGARFTQQTAKKLHMRNSCPNRTENNGQIRIRIRMKGEPAGV